MQKETTMRSSMRPYDTYFYFRNTVTEMLCDRGYNAVSELTPSFPDFHSRFGPEEKLIPQSLGYRVSHISDPSNTLEVLFPGHKNVTARYMNILYRWIQNKESLKKLMIVMFPKCEIDPVAKTKMKDWPFEVEIVDGCDLFYNPVRQDEGWQMFEVLTDDEKETVVNQHELEGKEIPLMSKTDRIGRYFAVKEGQVIRITKVKANEDDPERVTFRLVKD